MELSDEETMLDRHGVAEYLHISLATVSRLTKSGQLPAYKLGILGDSSRTTRYKLSDVKALLVPCAPH